MKHKDKLIQELSIRTRRIRHLLVKFLAPSVYRTALGSPRPMIKFIAKNFAGKPLTGVEIGVLHGDNAKVILDTLSIHARANFAINYKLLP